MSEILSCTLTWLAWHQYQRVATQWGGNSQIWRLLNRLSSLATLTIILRCSYRFWSSSGACAHIVAEWRCAAQAPDRLTLLQFQVILYVYVSHIKACHRCGMRVSFMKWQHWIVPSYCFHIYAFAARSPQLFLCCVMGVLGLYARHVHIINICSRFDLLKGQFTRITLTLTYLWWYVATETSMSKISVPTQIQLR